MKRITAVLVVLMAVMATEAFAATHAKGALGFHRPNAPVGFRWWTSDKMAIDFGLGVEADESPDLESDDADATTHLIHFAVDAGIPFVWKTWDKVHVLFRPGINWTSEQDYITGPNGPEKDRSSTMKITAEFEGEVFLVENFSVSASHGICVRMVSPPGDGDSTMDFGTIGDQFTEVGFHMYIFGGE